MGLKKAIRLRLETSPKQEETEDETVMNIFKKFKVGNNIIRDTFYASLIVFVLSSLTATIGQIIDGVIIGQFLGVDSIAAFGLINPLITAFVLFGAVITSGSRSRFTRLVGEGKTEDARGVFTLSCVLSVGMALICMMLTIIFSKQISIMLGAYGNATNLLEKSQAYLIGIAIGLPAMNAIRVLSAYMIIDNDKNRTVIATIIMTVVNILLDLFVVFVIHGDTLEMGITTSIGYYVSLFVLLLHFRKKDILLKFNFRSIKWKENLNIIKEGLPTGVCRLSNTVRSALMNNMLAIVASSGAIAAYTVHRSTDGFLNPITIGMADTVALISSILMGEQNRPQIKKLLKTSVNATFIFTLGISIIVFFIAPLFASLYIKDDREALSYAIRAVQCYAIGMPFYGLNLIYLNYLQGIGKSTLSSITGLLLEGGFLVLSAFIMLPMFNQEAIWMAFPVTQFLMHIVYGTIIFVYNYKNKTKYKNMWDRILLIPDSFDAKEEDKIDMSIYDIHEVIELSKTAWNFCTEHGCSSKVRYVISLSVEELAGNIIEHGFKDGKNHCIDLRIIKKDDSYIVRMRDNCILFDPKKQLELFSNEDLTRHIGLRMAFAMANDIQYTSVLKLNNLIIKI